MEGVMFDEIPVAGDAFRLQLVCLQHQKAICARCCMDFTLVNQLRYDKDYLLLVTQKAARLARIETVINQYFAQATPREVASNSSRTMSPRLSPLLETVLGNPDSEIEYGQLSELVPSLSYACHSHLPMKGRLTKLLDLLLQQVPDVQKAITIAELEKSKAEMKHNKKQDKAKMPKNSLPAAMNTTGHGFGEAVNEMMLILTKEANVDSFGSFFEEFLTAAQGIDNCTSGDGVNKIFTDMDLSGKKDNDKIQLNEDGLKATRALAEWLKFLLKHTEGGVPIDDPGLWPRSKLNSFLSKHGIVPQPRPPDSVLVKVARQLIKFCHCCLVVLESMPDNDHAAAMGRKAMGTATEQDLKTIAERNAPASKPDFFVEPQIAPGTRLSTLLPWDNNNNSPIERIFRARRGAHQAMFPLEILHQVFLSLESVADCHDLLQQKGSGDRIVMMSSDHDTVDEKTLAVRPIGARALADKVVPLLQVEYCYATKRGADAKTIQTLVGGLRKGTKFGSVTCSSRELDIVLSLLEENHSHLAQDDSVLQSLQRKIPRGWKFSVVAPADPEKKGGVMLCPGCSKPAAKKCARCLSVAYCCRDCQVACWKTHKRTCKKAQP